MRRLAMSMISLLVALWAAVPAGAQVAGRISLTADQVAGRDVHDPFWLKGEWKLHPGDDPAWADPAYDDRGWSTARPGLLERNTALRGPGRGDAPPEVVWLRLRMELDSSLHRRPLGLRITRQTLGAAQLFLNGTLIYDGWRQGGDGRVAGRVPLAGELWPMRLAAGEHLLAVRYSLASAERLQERSPLHTMVGTSVGIVPVPGGDPTGVLTGYVRTLTGHLMLFVGLLLAFGVIHLVLYLFFSRPLSNLFFALFAFAFALHTWATFLMTLATDPGRLLWLRDVFHLLVLPLTYTMGGLAIYSTFYRRLPWHFWAYLGLVVCLPVSHLLAPRVPAISGPVAALGAGLIGLGVIGDAVRARKEGARTIGAGFALLLGAVIVFETLPMLGVVPHTLHYGPWYGITALLLAASVHLARNHARTSRGYECLSRELEEANRTLERKVEQRTAELAASEQKYRTLVERASDPILLLDEGLQVVDVNRAAERLVGVPREQLTGRSMGDLCPADDRERYLDMLREQVRCCGPLPEDLTLVHADGHLVPVEISISRVKVDGRPMVQGIVHDLTERKRVEAALQQAKEIAEAASRTKSQFLANVSHELRTPLNAVIGYSEMLIEEAHDRGADDLVPDLQRVHTAGRHLLELINSVLDISKVEAGRMELFLERISIPEVLAEVADTIRPLVDRQGNSLEIRVQDELGEIYADRIKLRQILLNLLSNASKFTEGGTVALTMSRESDRGDGEWIRFEVRDSGIGMTPDQLSRLFEPFVQVDATAARKHGGTGLGLTITRRFVELMGGSVSVRSSEGAGTTFEVRLPARVAPLPQALPLHPEAAAALYPRSAPPTPAPDPGAPPAPGVLVIDDDPGARYIVRRMLSRDGYRVFEAADGSEGLALAREVLPDVVTLDVLLPGRDGWAVLAALKADPALRHIPVIMMTILEDRDLGFALGAADYLVKPVERDRLLEVLRRHTPDTAAGRVLIVEDDPDARELLRRAVEGEGWLALAAENGRVALTRMAEHPPDLILLDLVMPEMDGFELLDVVRGEARWRSIPVVVVTSKDLTEADRIRLRGGVERVLQKGTHSRDELVDEIRRLLHRPRTSDPLPA